MGQVWERQKGVCSYEPLFPFYVCATSLCVSPAENRKVRAKPEAARGISRKTPAFSLFFPLLFLDIFPTYLVFFFLFFSCSHTSCHSWYQTRGELLHTSASSCSPSCHQTFSPGCGLFSRGSSLDYWPPAGRINFKVRGVRVALC